MIISMESTLQSRWTGINTATRDVVNGWTIGAYEGGTCKGVLGREDRTTIIKFGSLNDANLAVQALARNGISTMEDVLSRDRSDVVRICCEALMW